MPSRAGGPVEDLGEEASSGSDSGKQEKPTSSCQLACMLACSKLCACSLAFRFIALNLHSSALLCISGCLLYSSAQYAISAAVQ